MSLRGIKKPLKGFNPVVGFGIAGASLLLIAATSAKGGKATGQVPDLTPDEAEDETMLQADPYIPAAGLAALQVSQTSGITPNTQAIFPLSVAKAIPIYIGWIKNVYDYRNIYVGASLKSFNAPLKGTSQTGVVQINNAHCYLGGTIANGLRFTAKYTGDYYVRIRQYTGPNAQQTVRLYVIKVT